MIPFCGQSYYDLPVSAQETINFYPEVVEDQQGKVRYCLKPTPGLVLFSTPTTLARGRGMHAPSLYRSTTAAVTRMYYVAGNTVYTASSNGTTTALSGTLETTVGQCYFANNAAVPEVGTDNKILMITDGLYAYYVDMDTNTTVTRITDTNFTSVCSQPERVVFNDGYFLVMDKASQRFQISPNYWNGTDSWSATNYRPVESTPDNNTAMVVLNDMIWIFGTDSYEIYIDTGATVPYERVPGAENTIGTIAPDSVACNGNNVFWLGSNANGQGSIFMNEGYAPRRISHIALERDIEKYTAINNAEGYCYKYGGHKVYQITFPAAANGAGKTYCYDIETGQWYRKTYLNNGVEERHRTCRSEAFVEKVMVQDWENGKVYYYDKDTYTDNGDTIRRVRKSPTMPADGSKIKYPRFELLCRVGAGLATGTTDPQVMLQISNDGGHTFGPELWESLGVSGDYKERVLWRQLGTSRNRVWKVAISDPIDCELLGAVTKGAKQIG